MVHYLSCCCFRSLLLLGLLFVVLVHDLGDHPLAHAYQGGDMNEDVVRASGGDQKELLEGLFSGTSTRKMLQMGRKMMTDRVEMEKEKEKVGASKISGKENDAALKKPLEKPQDQQNHHQEKMKTLNPNMDYPNDHHQTQDEERKLAEVAKELENLMHADYKGMGRRKPPINNHEPRH